MAGATVADSREQLAATLAADPDDQLERRAAMLDALMHSTAAPASRPTAQVGYRMVRDAIVAAADHRSLPDLSDEQIVNLVEALSDPEVRDQCLMAADSDHADAAERLWTMLTRATPAPERAQPAVLLAVHAYLRGDGVLAAIALGIARDADPEHILTRCWTSCSSTARRPQTFDVSYRKCPQHHSMPAIENVATLVRLVAARRDAAAQRLWLTLFPLLTPAQKVVLDALLEISEGGR